MERMRLKHEALLAQGPLLLSSVLIEQGNSTHWAGYTPNYLRVLIPKGKRDLRNKIVEARANEIQRDSASGDVSLVAAL